MIRLARVMKQFKNTLLHEPGSHLLPSHRAALSRIEQCRSQYSPKMQTQCTDCDNTMLLPHSCGHRSCPHCQHVESQRWIERQQRKQLPVSYFMLTFTVPTQLRELFWQHQRVLYDALFCCVKETLMQFTQNDKKLAGNAGFTAVLHTHSRELRFHPHLHVIMPAGALNTKTKIWKTKNKYLFNHKALAKVFAAKLKSAITAAGFAVVSLPKKWVVDCKKVGAGDKAIIYLGRYLYRGVIREKDILKMTDTHVTYQFKNSKTKRYQTCTLTGKAFLSRIFQHILPRGFRRSRDYGFLHANAKHSITLLHYVLKFSPIPTKQKPRADIICLSCGGIMHIIETRIMPIDYALITALNSS